MNRLIASLVGLAALLLPAAAWPCGGFFCSGGPGLPPPVIQTGEKILFGFEAGGEVTAHVQILYAGEPRAFAWVVPVPSVPTLSVGSDQLFTLLDQGTTPTFSVRFTNSCPRGFSLGCGGSPVSIDRGGGSAVDGGTGVTVISQAPVGPFDTAILASTNAQALQDWLRANGFDVSASTDALIAPYVAKGDYFVALKLQSGKSAGDLQPIVLKYKSTEGPCVPIRLTAAAAQADMGVAVFLLGSGRAVPTNYLHLSLNEARINWQTRGANYAAVVSAAADEAGGRAFVTDFSGPNTAVKTSVNAALLNYDRQGGLNGTSPDAFVRAVRASGFLGASQNVLEILQRCVPIPAGVTTSPLAFYQQWESSSAQVTQTVVAQPKCAQDFDALVVEPLRSAAAMMDRLPVLTRLYTSMSPNEMTVDPIFVVNPDLPPVARVRTLDAEVTCDSNGPTSATITGSDGARFSVPWQGSLDKAPALLRAEKMTDRGAPVVTLDNSEKIKQANHDTLASPGGCMAAGGSSLIAIAVAMFVVIARRRRGAP